MTSSNLNTTHFLGCDCVQLSNGLVELLVTQNVGPRILRLQVAGGPNLLAELPDVTIDTPGVGVLHLRGGHRLWHAPEVPERTYLPDDQPVQITAVSPHTLHIIQPTESQTGLQKSLHLTLPDETTTVVIDHTLTNQGQQPVECAPWAITQLKTGGVAILPQSTTPSDPYGLQPNRCLVLWPYTDINSPHIHWGNQYIQVHAALQEGFLKLGFPNPIGWLAYHWQGMLFVKTAVFQPAAPYFDMGASSQCYCNRYFIELETLGPHATLPPGDSITHRETWHIFPNHPQMPSGEAIQALMEAISY